VPISNLSFTSLATRLNSFRGEDGPKRSPQEALELLATVPGITATELNYPQHFTELSETSPIERARQLGLNVTALNLRFDPPLFAHGAFTHPNTEVRETAVATAIEAVEIAVHNDIDHVILWLGPDGFDYPLQADYEQLWAWAIAGIGQVAAHDPSVRVSIEYKPSDPRRYSLIRTMSDALLAARDVGARNVGVTLDFCHALMCGEAPAMAALLAIREQKLFGIHLNDGYGPADDGMMVGSVHPWQTLELLIALKRAGWDGTIYFDTFPGHVDPVTECAANIATVRRMDTLLNTIDVDDLAGIQGKQDGVGAARLLLELLRP
jgi:xylose isomerase